MQSFALLAFVLATAINYVQGESSSLYIPDFDPQPLSVDVLGVGPDGETTYRIQAGQPTGIYSTFGSSDLFPGTVTLVEGPSNAFVSFAVETVTGTISCAIANGIAECNAAANGQSISLEETISPIPIQLGTAAASVPTSSTLLPTSPPSSVVPAPTSQVSITQTASIDTPSSTPRSGSRKTTSISFFAAAAAVIICNLFAQSDFL